jgi:hypothetical protein
LEFKGGKKQWQNIIVMTLQELLKKKM